MLRDAGTDEGEINDGLRGGAGFGVGSGAVHGPGLWTEGRGPARPGPGTRSDALTMSLSLREPEADGRPFWEAAATGRLILQRCRSCAAVRFPPRHQCPHCWSPETEWIEAVGHGEIESITVVHRAPIAALRERVPFALVAVLLSEGVRMITNLIGDGALDARIGDLVEVCFEQRPNGTLPQFQLASRPAGARP